MKSGLSLKQEKACRVFLETGNKTQAYREAYDTSRMKPATVNRRAFELFENGKVQARLASLRAKAEEKTEYGLEWWRTKALALMEKCDDLGDNATARGYMDMLAKHWGAYEADNTQSQPQFYLGGLSPQEEEERESVH